MPTSEVSSAVVSTIGPTEHVALRVRDLEPMVQWYKDVFGFEETHRFSLPDYIGADADLVYLRLRNMQLEIVGGGNPEEGRPEPMTPPETFSHTGYQHFCLEVEDIDVAKASLEEAGIDVYIGPNTNTNLNRSFIHFKDPEGNDIELVEYEDG